MKKSKKLIAVLLSAIIGISSVSVFGSYAAQTDESVAAEAFDEVAAAQAADEAAAEQEEENAAAEPEETVVTEPATAEPTTQPTTQPVPKPGNVKNVQKTSFLTDTITLTWDKVPGASGYYVYTLNADGGNWTKSGDVTTNTFTQKKLSPTTQYHFQISAYIIKDGKKYEGNRTLKKTATQPCKVPDVIRGRSSEVVQVSWGKVAKATGYRIYRTSEESGNKEVLYATVNGNATTFIDKNVKLGKIYVYNVRAYRDLYNTTYNSPSSRLTFLSGLCAPNFAFETKLNKVHLRWNYNKYATRYDIYYSTDKNAKAYTKVGSTTKNTFITPKLSNSKTLYFRVYPIYKTSTRLITGTAHTKAVNVSNKIYGKNPGSTYVEISIDNQHMWFYKNGKLLVETDVVTGNADGWHNTPKGYFSIYQRARNTTLTGPGYSSFVSYWMAFCGGCGIHDASWRSNYGGTIYKGNGSHGCVNTPYNKVKVIYDNTGYGTPVIVY